MALMVTFEIGLLIIYWKENKELKIYNNISAENGTVWYKWCSPRERHRATFNYQMSVFHPIEI